MKKYPVIMAVILVIVAITLLGAAKQRHNRNEFLADVIKAQRLPVEVSTGKYGSRECYPAGKASMCPDLVITLKEDTCREVQGVLGRSTKQSGDSCQPYYKTVSYRGKNVKLYVGPGDTGSIYWVQAWTE